MFWLFAKKEKKKTKAEKIRHALVLCLNLSQILIHNADGIKQIYGAISNKTDAPSDTAT